jgi:hypothetical protein
MKLLNFVDKIGRVQWRKREPFQNEISSSIVSIKVFGLGDCVARLISSSGPDSLRFA